MVKQKSNRSNVYTIRQLEHQIFKEKSFSKNISNFIKKLRTHYPKITTKQYLIKLHNFIVNFRLQTKGRKQIGVQAYKYAKVCKKCQDWRPRHKLIQCIQCQDNYHKTCANNTLFNQQQWICKDCQHLLTQANRQSKLDQTYGKQSKKKKKCSDCNQQISEDKNNNKKICCIRCLKSYHQGCYKYQRNILVCIQCHKQIQKQMKNRQSISNILASQIKKMESEKQQFYNKALLPQNSDNSTQDQNSITVSIAPPISLKPPLILTKQQIQKYKKQLIYVILSKDMVYTQKNIYSDIQIPKNIEQIDLSIQRMSQKDFQAYIKYKNQPIGPYEVYPVEGLGYDVRAKKKIPKGTIICQYVGQVITRRKAIQYANKSDSLMQLLNGTNADNSFILMPFKYTNIARFINGINNFKKQSILKANVQSVRFNVVGQPKVLLYAKKMINEGDTLQYDYNAGGKGLFPTEEFI